MCKKKKKKSYSILSKEIMKLIESRERNDFIERTNMSEKQTDFIMKHFSNISTKIHNTKNSFLDTKGKKHLINYNKQSQLIALPGTQRTMKSICVSENIQYNTSLTAKENLMIILETYSTTDIISAILNKVPSDGYLEIINKSLKAVETFNFSEFNIKNLKLSEDILGNKQFSTWNIKSGKKVVFQLQVPPSIKRPNDVILRVNIRNIDDIFTKMKKTNEQFGISTEVALCIYSDIESPDEYEGRYSKEIVEDLVIYFEENNFPKMKKNEATKRVGQTKSPTDFIGIDDSKISVKSNINGSTKVCPPSIGQPGVDTGIEYYKKVFSIDWESFRTGNHKEFKKMFIENICKIMNDQLKYLNTEDMIIYVRKRASGFTHKIINKETLSDFDFCSHVIKFTRDENLWNESTSISVDGISIAEMQMHSQRSPFKFRFNLPNLLKLVRL
ncbi:MAG: hypothetical protein KAG14_00425 [Mycoplasmataceae bacterium]|nr:hypothetical protein [Mycoplasmataceae bacterium]